MNPHDQTGPEKLRPVHLAPRADFMLARLFATLLFGVVMLVVGFFLGEYRGTHELKACVEQQPRQQNYPKTKAEMRAFIKSHTEQADGWIK